MAPAYLEGVSRYYSVRVPPRALSGVPFDVKLGELAAGDVQSDPTTGPKVNVVRRQSHAYFVLLARLHQFVRVEWRRGATS